MWGGARIQIHVCVRCANQELPKLIADANYKELDLCWHTADDVLEKLKAPFYKALMQAYRNKK